MAIYVTAHYQVKPSAVDKVKRAIEEFVAYVRAHEPGTRMYMAWQQQGDPTRFTHFFIFESADARSAHGKSDAVEKFKSVYVPELVGGGVVFTEFAAVASNQG